MSLLQARRWASVLSLLAISATPAAAQEVTLSATTTGCFYLFSTPATCTSSPLSFLNGGQLAFTGSSFSGTTVGGVLANLNVGTFTLSGPGPISVNSPDWYFRLTTLFTAPTVIVGGQSATFAANLTGRISDGGSGAINVDWTVPTSQSFTYANSQETGAFTYGLVDNNGANVATGASSVVATPEPASVGLMATGLLGIFAIRRRKA